MSREQHVGYTLTSGKPEDGPGGTLAGTAEPGAQLHVQRGKYRGTYVNRGTTAAPRWERWGARSVPGRWVWDGAE